MNTLFYGDNLDILRKPHLIASDSVDLAYVDPPFNSKRNYNQIYNRVGKEDLAQAQAFVDTWTWDEAGIAEGGLSELLNNPEGRFTAQTVALLKGLTAVLGRDSLLAYLVSMTLRCVEIHRVLKPTGSFYLHCDPSASHYLKLVLDSIYLPNSGEFQNEIIWKRTHSHGGAKRFGPVHDVLLFYTKSNIYTWNKQHTGYSDDYQEKFFRFKDSDGRLYRSTILTGSGTRNGASGKPWRDYDPTSSGRHWAIPGYVRELIGPTSDVQDALDKLDAIGRILWPKAGVVPSFKQYLDDMPGVALQDIFTDVPPISAQAAERLGYPTQKPEALLERIIAASSNVGDVVLDAYCGCGTTVAVAQRLNRQWLGIDITYQSIALILRRLEAAFGNDAANLVKLNGVPRDLESATALALKKDDRTRKEFEKWAVLTYTHNRALINEKKGADGGIDGVAFTQTSSSDNAKLILQVKSGGVNSGDIDALRGAMGKFEAEMSVFITLKEPSTPMQKAAAAAGTYKHPVMGREYPRIKIVTVREMVEDGARLDLPMPLEVLKKAARAKESSASSQNSLLDAVAHLDADAQENADA